MSDLDRSNSKLFTVFLQKDFVSNLKNDTYLLLKHSLIFFQWTQIDKWTALI